MKKRSFRVWGVGILIVVFLLFTKHFFFSDIHPDDTLTRSQKAIFYKAILKVGVQNRQKSYLLLANHFSVVKANDVCIEYQRSSGLSLIDKLERDYHFISPTKGWDLPGFSYAPIKFERSDHLNYEGKLLDPIYKIGEYGSKGYRCEIAQLLIALMAFGPLNIDKVSDFRIFFNSDNSDKEIWCFGFESKKFDYSKNPFSCSGNIYIDLKTETPIRIESDNVEYNSINHGVIKNFGKLPSYDIAINISLKKFNENLIFFDKVEMILKWIRNEGVGRLPPRPDAVANNLVEKEFFYINTITSVNHSDSLKNLFDTYTPRVQYDKEYWKKDTVGLFLKSAISGEISKQTPLDQQFEHNDGKVLGPYHSVRSDTLLNSIFMKLTPYL